MTAVVKGVTHVYFWFEKVEDHHQCYSNIAPLQIPDFLQKWHDQSTQLYRTVNKLIDKVCTQIVIKLQSNLIIFKQTRVTITILFILDIKSLILFMNGHA